MQAVDPSAPCFQIAAQVQLSDSTNSWQYIQGLLGRTLVYQMYTATSSSTVGGLGAKGEEGASRRAARVV